MYQKGNKKWPEKGDNLNPKIFMRNEHKTKDKIMGSPSVTPE